MLLIGRDLSPFVRRSAALAALRRDNSAALRRRAVRTSKAAKKHEKQAKQGGISTPHPSRLQQNKQSIE